MLIHTYPLSFFPFDYNPPLGTMEPRLLWDEEEPDEGDFPFDSKILNR